MRLADLRSLVLRGEVPEYVFFHGRGLPFSQWSAHGFEIEGVFYLTAEHYMMAEKARIFGDREKQDQIIAAPSPEEAKALGRQVRGFDENLWQQCRLDVVVRGNCAKFGGSPLLRAVLLGTGSRVLAEASRTDLVWGIGWSERDWQARHPTEWRGQNLLGFALMRVRDELREAT